VTSTDELTQKVQFLSNAMGTAQSPFDAWLVLRGIETLAVRMRQHLKNAAAVADFLNGHPAVQKVYFPGLKSHPGYRVAKKQMNGFGGMVSFEIHGGPEAAKRFLRKTRVFALAESLGGAASLAEHPATMSHASMPDEYRKQIGIKDELIRLSVGLEDIDDLIDDLRQALESE
jgi:cystathionine beta-lyase/cystathionine gamma-synthase